MAQAIGGISADTPRETAYARGRIRPFAARYVLSLGLARIRGRLFDIYVWLCSTSKDMKYKAVGNRK